jgi:hypothetical protein
VETALLVFGAVVMLATVIWVLAFIETWLDGRKGKTAELLRWPDGELTEMHRNGDGKSAEDAIEIDRHKGE